MGLQFMDEAGVYLPGRNAIKISGVDGDRVIDCYVKTSALAAFGASSFHDTAGLIAQFEKYRDDIEIAAMVKYRRTLGAANELEIDAKDLAPVLPASAA